MELPTIQFELAEACEHLQALLSDINTGQIQRDDEPALAVQLGHILDHINLAWNCKDLSVEQIGQLPQAEFEGLSNAVPNFLGTKTIGEFALGA